MADQDRGNARSAAGAAWIASIYGVVGGLWIVLSDRMAAALFADDAAEAAAQTIKGLAYIGMTSALLYWLVRRHDRRLGEAERQVIESGKRYHRLLNEAPVAILAAAQGRISFANRAAAALLGGGLEPGPTDRLLSDLMGPEAVAQIASAADEAVRGGRTIELSNMHLTGAGGRDVTANVTVAPNPGDGASSALLALVDVSEQRVLEGQLAAVQKLEAVGHLAAGITHDFNNVLTAIFGQVHLLRKMVQGSKASDALDQVTLAARQAESITRGLMAFARPGAPEQIVTRLADIVLKSAELIRPALPATVELRVDATSTASVEVDPMQVQQALMNLIIHARDAMPSGGIIGLRIVEGRGPGEAVVEISDTGPGMSAEGIAHLYEPSPGGKPEGKGTGLGLPVARRILERHGARIEVDSTPAKGTTFRVTLPTLGSGGPGTAHGAATPRIRPGVTAIVAEDSGAVRAVIGRALTDMGINVLEARDGDELLDVYRRSGVRPHLLVLDLDMPGISGHECLREIREADPFLPVLICSGSIGSAPETMGEGPMALLRKPFDVPNLQRAVAEMLNGAASRA